MKMLSQSPAATYRKIDLDARIEASASADLTRICLEEAVTALSQALLAIERTPERTPRDPLARAHGIALYLARSVAPENPLRDQLTQFYGSLANAIARNLREARSRDIRQIREDFADLLEASRKV